MNIDRNNYESFFLLYLDRELSPAEMKEVDGFLNENTDLRKEFVLFQQTILSPAEILFEPKELLMRREETRKPVPMYWVRIAAAVAVLIMGSWFFISTVNNHRAEKSGETAIAEINPPAVKAAENPGAENKNKPGQGNEVNNLASQNSGKALAENLVREKSPNPNKSSKFAVNTNNGKKITGGLNGGNDLQSGVDMQNLSVDGLPEESDAVIQKSNANVDLQSGLISQEKDSKQIAALTGLKAVPIVVATGPEAQIENEYATVRDVQTDNAISVVALNDNNKAIAGFFKKLTKRAPADETTNSRKLRVSVFQISY